MSLTASSPACVAVNVTVDNNALPMDWASENSLSPPTYLLSNGPLPESDDDIVLVGARVVRHRFLDDEGEIELMREKGASDNEVESEVDQEEVKVKVKEEKEEKEPDKEWRATGTWPSWSQDAGEEWG